MLPSPVRFLSVLTRRAIDFARRLRPAHRSPFPPTWPIDPADATRLSVEWPSRYDEPDAEKWVGNLRAGMTKLVPVRQTGIPQPHDGVVTFHLVWNGQRHPVAIDYADQMARIVDTAVRGSLVYFKLQYLRDGYGAADIVPGGFVNAPIFYHDVPWVRSLRTRGQPLDVFGRFGAEFAAETRARAVQLLSEQSSFRYDGSMSLVRYAQSLREAAQAKICIDMPGGGDFCFRLVDYLGIGAFVIASPHRTALHVPIEDRKHVVYCRPDLSDLVELCRHYLAHPEERAVIADNAREHFDRYLHRDQLAGYYLSRCIKRLKGG